MEKLLKLLNEYRKQNPREFFGDDGSLVVLTWKDFIELNRYIIISKEYWFIKWLVDNNKIDFTKDCIVEFWYYWTEWYCDKYDNIIMNLSIQDNPIEFLISILK